MTAVRARLFGFLGALDAVVGVELIGVGRRVELVVLSYEGGRDAVVVSGFDGLGGEVSSAAADVGVWGKGHVVANACSDVRRQRA